MKKFAIQLMLLGSLALAGSVQAQAPDLTDGEVRKIDKDAGKLTLKHGPIKHMDMPGMTMVFQVKDKALLETLKVGEKIRFQLVSEQGRYVVTEIQAAP
jgi:Cu(I)/Ag(I) efflux system protein CusF